jgi:MFS family permease
MAPQEVIELPGYDSDDNAYTPLEKKFRLVDHEIDRHGMGKYQWFVWTLCGLGYLLDLLWAQAFGLVLGPLQQEFGFSGKESGNISVAFSAGLTVGAFFWGIMGDIIGRRWAFNLTCAISGAFGAGLGAVDSYNAFLALVVFIGFGVGGNIPVDTTICLEFIPSNRRFLLAALSIFQPIGVVGTSAIAYGFVPSNSCEPNFSRKDALPSCRNVAEGEACCERADNMGWRYVLYTLGAINILVFFMRFAIFTIHESPKFLLSHGRNEKAIEVLQKVAKVNGQKCGLTLADFENADAAEEDADFGAGGKTPTDTTYWLGRVKAEVGKYKQLFANKHMARVTILVWLTYICDFWGFTLSGAYFPKIIAIKDADVHLTLRQTYRNYMAIYTPGIVGVLLGAMLIRLPKLGRKWTMTFSSGMMGLSIIIFSFVNTQASNTGLNAMEYFFQSMFNAVLYGWTPEVFPAEIRGTAVGVATTWGRLFSIIAPLTAQNIIGDTEFRDADTIKKVLYLAGGITLGCVLTTALLPNKIKRR